MLRSYFSKILLLSMVIALVTYILFTCILKDFFLPVFPLIILFFLLVNLIFHYTVLRISKKKMSKFANNFMLSSTLKLLAYILFIVIYLLLDKENALLFVVYFFSLYILYTAFEVMMVLPEIKRTNTNT